LSPDFRVWVGGELEIEVGGAMFLQRLVTKDQASQREDMGILVVPESIFGLSSIHARGISYILGKANWQTNRITRRSE
jgi:hypothetical protein